MKSLLHSFRIVISFIRSFRSDSAGMIFMATVRFDFLCLAFQTSSQSKPLSHPIQYFKHLFWICLLSHFRFELKSILPLIWVNDENRGNYCGSKKQDTHTPHKAPGVLVARIVLPTSVSIPSSTHHAHTSQRPSRAIVALILALLARIT